MSVAASDLLIQDVASFAQDPLRYALYSFPWGEGDLQGVNGPREWQADILDAIGERLRDPSTRFNPIRVAVASGHGIGKSALIAMLVKWGLDTCDDCRIVVTANTDTQLRNKTFPEVTKWSNLAITTEWFKPTATSLVSSDKGHEKTWRCDAVPWSKDNTEAFAGLHNKRKRIIVIFDEASAIDDKIWEVTEGALTDEDTEIIWIAFGNPTRSTGRFRECFRKFKHLWITRQIDSRTVEGTNKKQLDEWVTTYGEDSDFVKVRIRGVFPVLSARQFVSEVDVDEAFGRHLRKEQYDFAPVILTCDPAWEGDDELVIAKRQGLKFDVLRVIPKNDNDLQIGSMLAQLEDEHQADAVFVDAGYGTGIVSFGRTMQRTWQLVWFGGKSDSRGYRNKRSEMWGKMKTWLKEGGAIPPDNGLRDELLSPETLPDLGGVIALEPKDAMKKRGLPSPNKADALALTFAYDVAKKPRLSDGSVIQDNRSSDATGFYNPFG